MFSSELYHIPTEKIVVPEDRQRRAAEIDSLALSIKWRGLLHPIIIRRDFTLVAGGRRLAAFRKLAGELEGFDLIPARFVEDLSPIELRLVELEENIKRQDLTWQEQADAIKSIHEAYCALEEGWTMAKTAERLNISANSVGDYISVAEHKEEINTENRTFRQARNVIRRQNDRAIAAALEDIAEVVLEEKPPRIQPAEESILIKEFNLDWVKSYDGPKFNFVHCDFPYGMNYHKTGQGNTGGHKLYDDSEETFEDLCKTLAWAQDIFSHSCHIMFWFDMARLREVRDILDLTEFEFFPIPLIWHKTDNKGVLSDPMRRPRHIYEAALIGVRGDRKIVQSVSDVYGCPTYKDEHLSVKSEPMLRHFFQMYVDKHTVMLDPTCGSGSALRAAESLGAKYVLGLEKEAEFAESARRSLRQFRDKQFLEKTFAREEKQDHDS